MRFILFFLAITACSTSKNEDPHEEFNRDMMGLNLSIDKNILKPTSEAYKSVTSDGVRSSVSNALSNLKEPYYFVNYIARFDLESSANSLFRFIINSVFGFVGAFDVCGEIGLEKAETSYKDTMYAWGIKPGNYVLLPILGSNSTNYVVGEPVSWFCDPLGYIIGFPYMFLKTVMSAVNDRAENSATIDNVTGGSIDPYSIMKSMYSQKYSSGSTESPEIIDSPMP
jgi:phospholipid-binding lipoprotein MlaA